MGILDGRIAAPFALIVVMIVLGTVLTKTFYALTNPLSKLPGPLISKWTNLRLKVAVITGERVRYVHGLHEQYGPIVRISPFEVSLADVTAARTIYKIGSPFLKSVWYESFTKAGAERGIFAMVDPAQHSQHRRLTSYNFSEKWIRQLEPDIARNTRLAAQKMQDEAQSKGYCDVFKWFTFMATDVIGEAAFGQSFEMLRTGKKNQYIYDLEVVGKRGAIRAELPLLAAVSKYVPFARVNEVNNRAASRLHAYAEQSIQRYWRQLRADPEHTKPTLLTKEYAGIDAGTITEAQLRVDARGYIIAGTDTTAITATYAVWFLAQNRETQDELIREVASLPDDFTDEDLKPLQVLTNVMNETLRMRAPVGQSLPRSVPAEGAHFNGFFVPGGMTVGIQAYTMHYSPDVWRDPERFDPSRWNSPTKEMKDSFLPFGGGSRICIGMHLAQLELRYALANFYRAFESGVQLSSAEGFTEDDMLPVSYFLTPPKGKRCLVERRK